MMEILEVTNKRALVIWWSYTWRAVLLAGLAGLATGFVLGIFFGIFAVLTKNEAIIEQASSPLGGTAGAITGIVVSILVLKLVLKKKFREFRIVLIKNEQ